MVVPKKESKKLRVFVGMSGGVDSSVSAALLKEAGFDVTGVFIKVWKPEYIDCGWKEDRFDAMRVCAKLDVPFLTLNLENEYKKDVVDYMIAEYKAGRTPNPDVMCNKYIKFGGFFKKAMELGADYVATGHYARVELSRVESLKPTCADRSKVKSGEKKKEEKEIFNLLAGKDGNKDQSYFLWILTQKELSKTLFPVGDLEKPEVRKLAIKYDLVNATKKDSQGLCFMGKVDVKDFLKKYIKEKEGDVINEKGEKIGRHSGVFYFTLGERHGFKITKKTPNDKPYYIIAKDFDKNTLTVSQDIEKIKNENSKKILLKNVNLISGDIEENKMYQARIRYRQPLEPCSIVKSRKSKGKRGEREIELHFANPQKSVTPGQSAVIYDREVCLGGGIIE